MDFSPSPFARLPWELVRRIVTIASISSRRSALELCLTAQWVNQIANPCLLRTLVLKNIQDVPSLVKHLGDAQTPLGISRSTHVRHGWMDTSLDPSNIAPILRVCAKMEHLAIPAESFPGLVVATTVFTPADLPLPFSHDLHLTLLNTATHPAWFAGFLAFHRNKDSLLSHITHLRLVETGPYRDCMPTHYYPKLSHFMVPYRGVGAHELSELNIFLSRESLKMLVIEIIPSTLSLADLEALKNWAILARKTDKRICVVERPSDDLQGDWEDEMRSGDDIWQRSTCHPLSCEILKASSTASEDSGPSAKPCHQ